MASLAYMAMGTDVGTLFKPSTESLPHVPHETTSVEGPTLAGGYQSLGGLVKHEQKTTPTPSPAPPTVAYQHRRQGGREAGADGKNTLPNEQSNPPRRPRSLSSQGTDLGRGGEAGRLSVPPRPQAGALQAAGEVRVRPLRADDGPARGKERSGRAGNGVREEQQRKSVWYACLRDRRRTCSKLVVPVNERTHTLDSQDVS